MENDGYLYFLQRENASEPVSFSGLRSIFPGSKTIVDPENGDPPVSVIGPGVIIIDMDLYGDLAPQRVQAIHSSNSELLLILLTDQSDQDNLLQCLKSGADCSINKTFPPEEIGRFISRKLDLVLGIDLLQRDVRNLTQFRDAVDSCNLISRTDPLGTITYVNDRFVEISGFTRDELVGSPHNIVRHPNTSSAVFKNMWSKIQDGKVWNGIIQNQRKSGESYYVDATIQPIYNKAGRISEYLAIRHDVTELETYREILEMGLKDTTRGLQEKVQRILEYEKAIDSANAFTRISPDGKLTYINHTFSELVQRDPKDLIGKSFFKLMHISCLKERKEEIRKVLSSKKVWQGDYRFSFPDGGICYTRSVLVPILDGSGTIVEVMGIHHDINEVMKLNQDIEDTQKEVLFRMGELAEARSKETGNHVRRVAEYSKVLALAYGLDQDTANLLQLAAPMHDIGKVGIPDSILNKPGRLTPDEFQIMKRHAEIGYEMLHASGKEILHAASIIAREHHEKWDGTGYPNSLAGEQIHIYGRITAIADVFDALGTERVYKAAWSGAQIRDYFLEQRGKHFDPVLTDLFLDKFEEFESIRERFRDPDVDPLPVG